MKRAVQIGTLMSLCFALDAQTNPSSSPTGEHPRPVTSPMQTSGTSDGQAIAGVLMDATCNVIARSREPGDATAAETGARSRVATTGTSAAGSRGVGGSVSSSEGISDTTTTGTSAAGSRGVGGSVSRSTATSDTTTDGTSAAGSRGVGGSISASRHTSDATTSASFTTVREKYANCMVTPSTTRFAIHADGRLHILDDKSNEIVRQQMSNEAFRASMSDASGQPKWMSVTVMGTSTGDRLSVTSVRK